jgi:C-terminal processing protease CtpA/Prc
VYRPRALAAPNDGVFASVLAQMLMELHDRHVSLTAGPSAATLSYHAPEDFAPVDFDPNVIDKQYVSQSAPSTPHLRVGWLTTSVGYIRIGSFGGSGWEGELDAALQSLEKADRLVVDIRGNFGGSYELAVAMAGRFASAPSTFGYVRLRNGPSHDDLTDYIAETVTPQGRQFTGPVYLLTNRRVYSAAEDFTLALRGLPNVTVVGDTTGGSSGKPTVRQLANGWTYELSTWIQYTPDRRAVEDAGLAPSVVVPGSQPKLTTTASSAASSASKRDVVLDRVLQLAGSAP